MCLKFGILKWGDDECMPEIILKWDTMLINHVKIMNGENEVWDDIDDYVLIDHFKRSENSNIEWFRLRMKERGC